jgi:DNA-binding MarR family transcriptional regulator
VTDPSPEEIEEVMARLAALDRRGTSWTRTTLRLIDQYPGIAISALARQTRLDRTIVKSNVQRLLDLGVVERSGTGHRLTPLGASLLRTQG